MNHLLYNTRKEPDGRWHAERIDLDAWADGDTEELALLNCEGIAKRILMEGVMEVESDQKSVAILTAKAGLGSSLSAREEAAITSLPGPSNSSKSSPGKAVT